MLELGICEESSVCVTTNWDDVLWSNEDIHNVLYLHGQCRTPASLILPTETIAERALKGVLLNESRLKLNELAEKENSLHLIDPLIISF